MQTTIVKVRKNASLFKYNGCKNVAIHDDKNILPLWIAKLISVVVEQKTRLLSVCLVFCAFQFPLENNKKAEKQFPNPRAGEEGRW